MHSLSTCGFVDVLVLLRYHVHSFLDVHLVFKHFLL